MSVPRDSAPVKPSRAIMALNPAMTRACIVRIMARKRRGRHSTRMVTSRKSNRLEAGEPAGPGKTCADGPRAWARAVKTTAAEPTTTTWIAGFSPGQRSAAARPRTRSRAATTPATTIMPAAGLSWPPRAMMKPSTPLENASTRQSEAGIDNARNRRRPWRTKNRETARPA